MTSLVTVHLVPVNRLPMDEFNDMMRQHAGIATSFSSEVHYISNKGYIYNDKDAFQIALDANQLADPSRTNILLATDLFPELLKGAKV